MPEIVIKIPEELIDEKNFLERRIMEMVNFEAKRKALLNFLDEAMKGAAELSDEELVNLGRKIKKGRFEKLKKRGLM